VSQVGNLRNAVPADCQSAKQQTASLRYLATLKLDVSLGAMVSKA
jgi:hypothetical protein